MTDQAKARRDTDPRWLGIKAYRNDTSKLLRVSLAYCIIGTVMGFLSLFLQAYHALWTVGAVLFVSVALSLVSLYRVKQYRKMKKEYKESL